jgi:hypothetical protein
LSRPDLSAREAVAIIVNQAGNSLRDTKAFSVTIAGAADVNGRLNIAVGGWDIRFLTSQPDQYIYARLFANGSVSYTRESMWDVPPPAFALDGEWIDSTLAAEIIKEEPLPPTMGEAYSLFLSLRFVTDIGLTWQVRRIYTEPANSLHVTQSFGVNASSSDIAAETIEMKKAGVLSESRHRNRIDDGEWVDNLGRWRCERSMPSSHIRRDRSQPPFRACPRRRPGAESRGRQQRVAMSRWEDGK